MSVYEDMFYHYGVDMVFNGHVHAYERTHPVYKYQLDTCGPIYVTIGDGGNIEGPYRRVLGKGRGELTRGAWEGMSSHHHGQLLTYSCSFYTAGTLLMRSTLPPTRPTARV